MSYKPHWKKGQWKAICDVCGKLFHSGQLLQRWDGFIVCKEDYETRHSMDFIRSFKEHLGTEWSRKEPTDIFNGPVYVEPTVVPVPTSIPATDQSSWTNPSNPNYSGPTWTVPPGSPPAPAFVNVAPSVSWNSPLIYVGQTMDPIIVSDPNAGDTVTAYLTSGSLPTGISLNSNGSFSGAATAEGDYFFVITPIDNHGLAGTPLSATVNVIRQFPSGEAPSGLTVISYTNLGCILSWVDNTAYETYYHLRRQRSGESTWTDLGTVVDSPYGTFLPANTTTYSDTFPVNDAGTLYTYQVRAVRVGSSNRHEYSSWSNNASLAVPAANAPVPAPAPAPSPAPSPAPAPAPNLVQVVAGGYQVTDTEFKRLYGSGKYLQDALGNFVIGQSGGYEYIASHAFRAEAAGNVTQIRTYLPDGPGYAAGNGGILRVRIFPDDGTSQHLPNLGGATLATGTLTLGMSSGLHALNNYATPITMTATAPLVKGTIYHIVYDQDPTNASPSTDWCGVNNFATVAENGRPSRWGTNYELRGLFAYRTAGGGGSFTWHDSYVDGQANSPTTLYYQPILQVTLSGGTSFGSVLTETGNVDATRVWKNTSANPIRERFTPSETSTMLGFSFNTATTTGGSLKWELKDNTTVLSTGTLYQTTANYSTVTIGSTAFGVYAWYNAEFTTPQTFQAGKTYDLIFTPVDGTWVFADQSNGGSYWTYPAAFTEGQAQWFDGTSWLNANHWSHSTSTTGSSWRLVLHKATASSTSETVVPGGWTFYTTLDNSASAPGQDLFLPISVASPLPTDLPAGSLIVIGMEWQGGSAEPTITNTSGQTWNYTATQNTGSLYSAVAWTYNNAAVSSGYNPCFHLDVARTDRACAIAVYTRTYAANNPYVDVKYYTASSSSSCTTAAMDPGTASGLCVSVVAHSNASVTVSPGATFTGRTEQDQIQIQIMDKIVSSAGSITAFGVLSGADAVIQTTLMFQDSDTTTTITPSAVGVPVYEYYKTGSVIDLKFRYGTSSTPPSGYTTQGIAFYGANSTDAGAVAIHEWSAGPDTDGDVRYAYDTVDTGGWTDTTNVAFYAFSSTAGDRSAVYCALGATSQGAFSFYTKDNTVLPSAYSTGPYLRYYVYNTGSSLALPTAPVGGGSSSSGSAAVTDNRIVCWHTPNYPWDSSIAYGIHDGKVRADAYYHMAELPSIGGTGPFSMTASSEGLRYGANGERVWRFSSEAAATTYLNNLHSLTSGALGSSRSTPAGSQGGVYYFRLQPPVYFTDGTTRADFNYWGNTIIAMKPYCAAFSVEILNGIVNGMANGSTCDLFDIHWSDNGAPFHQQPIELSLSRSGSNYTVNFRVTYNETNLSAAIPAGWSRKGDEPNEVYTFLLTQNIAAAHRYYFFLKWNISNDSNGYLQVWMRDGALGTTVKILDYVGRLGDNYNPSGVTYTFHPKLGLYQWWTPSETIDILSDGMLIFNDISGSYSLTPDAVINALITG